MNHSACAISSVILFPLVACSGQQEKPNAEKPNIVFIFADDMGYGDISGLNPYARTQTPAIDKLIGKGITFTEAHASASVCTPSRYGLLTGRYAFRSEAAARGIDGFTRLVIEPDRETLATILKNVGYTTACIGKWHLGVGWQTNDGKVPRLDTKTGYSNVDYTKNISSGPNDYGFDYSFIHPASLDIPPYLFLRNHQVVDADMILTTDHYPARLENTVFAYDKKHTDDLAVYWEKGVWWRQGEMSRSFRVENCHAEIVDEGVRFIDNQADSNPGKPFFLYLPLTGPHTPWMSSEQFRGTSAAGLYGDFISDIDNSVEQIHQALIRHGLEENTILIFSSDNGAKWPQEEIELYSHDSNYGRKGQKGDIWDGGHRVPLIISWPRKINGGSTCHQLVSLTDFFATFCHITGQKPKVTQSNDSFSFLHILYGKTEKIVRETMVHHSSSGFYGIRSGNWKFIDGLGSGGFTNPTRLAPEHNGPTGQLYNLKEDQMESRNLFFQYPEKVEELSALLKEIVSEELSEKNK